MMTPEVRCMYDRPTKPCTRLRFFTKKALRIWMLLGEKGEEEPEPEEEEEVEWTTKRMMMRKKA
jgi:hypothetical protein